MPKNRRIMRKVKSHVEEDGPGPLAFLLTLECGHTAEKLVRPNNRGAVPERVVCDVCSAAAELQDELEKS